MIALLRLKQLLVIRNTIPPIPYEKSSKRCAQVSATLYLAQHGTTRGEIINQYVLTKPLRASVENTSTIDTRHLVRKLHQIRVTIQHQGVDSYTTASTPFYLTNSPWASSLPAFTHFLICGLSDHIKEAVALGHG